MSGMAMPQCPGKCSRGYRIGFSQVIFLRTNLFCTEFIFYFSNSTPIQPTNLQPDKLHLQPDKPIFILNNHEIARLSRKYEDQSFEV